jgi:hypothetical protein
VAWYALTMLTLLCIKMWSDARVRGNEYVKWKNRVSIELRRIDHDNFDRRRRRLFFSLSRIRDNVYWIWTANVLRVSELSQQSHGIIPLSNTPVFYPLYFFGLYMVIGPFFIGEMIPSAPLPSHRYAGFFLHGLLFLDGTFIPLADTWLQALHELIYSYIPLVVYLSFCCTRPSRLYFSLNPRAHYPHHRTVYVRILVFIVSLYHCVQAGTPGLFYGWVSVVLSPGKTWFVGWACWVVVRRATVEQFKVE